MHYQSPGVSSRVPGPGPFKVTPLRGVPVNYGPRIDERGYAVHLPSSHLLPLNSSLGDDQEEAPPSRHLWVGNVSQEVTEGLLVEKFTPFGSIDSVTVYSQRNYAFINFKDVENARTAKNGLQGIVLGGLALRIEFAKGAKPSRHLWVGGIGSSVSREVIEGEFKRFGTMEDFKFLRDRNCAFVDYEKVEDAVSAVDSLNRKRLGDEELRVDFGRSQPHKRDNSGRTCSTTAREEWGGPHLKDNGDHPDKLRTLAEPLRSLPDARQSDRGSSGGSFRGPSDGYQAGPGPGSLPLASGKTRGEKEEPSDVLWVGFPLLSKVDEDGLRRAFVPFGEVERVKTFPGRTYAFVQFKKVEEASRAKAALEGKLFNDPRVHIRFSNSEIGPVDTPKTDGNCCPQFQGKDAPDVTEKAIGRVAGSDRLGSTVPLRSTGLRPEYFPGGLARGTVSRAVRAGAVISLGRGNVVLGPSDTETGISLDERDYQIGSQGGRGFSGSGGKLPCDEQLDFRDEDIAGREAKRPRMVHGEDADPSFSSIYQGGRRYPSPEHSGLGHGFGFGLGIQSSRESYGLSLSRNIGHIGDYSPVLGLSRVRMRSLQYDQPRDVAGVEGHRQSAGSLADVPVLGFTGAVKRESFSSDGAVTGVNEGWRWHGTIAKGGTPVCRARCLPVGKGIDVTVPDVVNCTARTDLDMLAKHVYQAGDFGVVFFVPEADPDVPPYHDFMHYLGEKHRAGVAKLVDGTTLFLVPPCEFSERVLKVPGNNCLFGVVLKARQPSPVEHAHLQLQPRVPSPQLHLPLQLVHPQLQQVVSHRQQHPLPQGMGFLNGHSTRDNCTLPATTGQNVISPVPTAASSTLNHPPLTTIAGGIPTVLTPELIASLTALLPAQNQPAEPFESPSMSAYKTQPTLPREGMGVASTLGRTVSISGSASSVPATIDNRSTHRSSQIHQQPVVQSQGWHSVQSELQLGIGGQISILPDQGLGYASTNQHQQAQQQPQVSVSIGTAQSHPGPQSQGLRGSGYVGHLVKQHPRAPHNPSQLASAPLLPSEQLAQLTALLTHRQQQPAQQQQAASYQQHQAPFSPLLQHQHPVLPSHQLQAQTYGQQPQHQQQMYAPFASSQQHWVQGGTLRHIPQPLGHLHVLSGSWDGTTVPEGGQQPQQLAPLSTVIQPQVSLPQQYVQQLMPTGEANGDQTGGASQDDTAERQKRFQATLQLAAALLQQMQDQENPDQGNSEKR